MLFIKSGFFCILLFLTACNVQNNTASTDKNGDSPSVLEAVFEWFEYEGHDSVFETPLKADQYRNPILAGFYPDPSVVRVGNDFYMVNSTFGYFPGIPIFHSRDLISWTQIGNVINRPNMMNFDGIHLSQQGLYAPTIEYHNGLFHVANTCVACGGNYLVTAKNPAGPWSDPIWLPDVGGIDPSLFFEDERVFIVNHAHPEGAELYDGHRAIWIREVNPVTFQSISDQKMLVDGGVDITERPIYIEGPHLYKRNGTYYLSAAEGGTGMDHRQVVFNAENIWGPYTPYENNPILTQRTLSDNRPDPITSTGHADLFTDPQGNCWAVFLATRTYDTIHFNTGRETFLLPCKWKNGWPVILDHDETVPYIATRPTLPKAVVGNATTGNFKARETFDSILPLDWLFIRIPKSKWWSTGNGKLVIKPRSQRIGDTAQPSAMARRVQHMNMSATAAIRFTPHALADEAGMVAIQNDAYYFTFGIGRTEHGQTALRLRQRTGTEDPPHGITLKETPLKIKPGALVQLRIEINGPVADFSYSLDGNTFTPFYGAADSSILSTMRAGGFVGALVGVYAEAE